MENFLRVWSIIMIMFFMISCIINIFENSKNAKLSFVIFILLAPVFYYIIKF